MSIRLGAIALLVAALPLGARAQYQGHSVGALPPFDASEPSAAEVTAETLLASERFWPYQTELVDAWPTGGASLPPGTIGVLIRIEPGRIARIDFGRDGLHEIPVDRTDLVARANQVREGKLEKLAANFALAIGPRLADASTEPLRPLGFELVSPAQRFLCVFADPFAKEFAALARQLRPLREREGLLTILFAAGTASDAAVAAKLREAKWPVPFVFQHLAEPYARTLIDPDVGRPALLLQTSEGRVLAGPGTPRDVLPQIEAALAKSLP